MIYAVIYDLKKPGQDYSDLYGAIKSCGVWWHYVGSTWLIDTSMSAQGIWQKLASCVDKNDRVLVIGLTRDYQGWLSQDAWDWINARTSKLVA